MRRHFHRNERTGLWLPDGSRGFMRGIRVNVLPGASGMPAQQYSLAAVDGIGVADGAVGVGGTLGAVASDGIGIGDSVLDPGLYAAPDILNNENFGAGWGGFTDWGYHQPPTLTTWTNVASPRTLGRDSGFAFAGGSHSIVTSLPDTSAPVGDLGAQFLYSWYHLGVAQKDRIRKRFYFYLHTNSGSGTFNGTLKFCLFFSGDLNSQYGGLYLQQGGYLGWFFTDNAATGSDFQFAQLSSLKDGVHYVEMDYWRLGHPSGFPAVALRLDNVPITAALPGHLDAPITYSGGFFNAGVRGSDSPMKLATGKIGATELLGVLNGATAAQPGLVHNTVPSTLWVGRVAISSVGDIGP